MSTGGTAFGQIADRTRIWPTRGDALAICLLGLIVVAGWVSGTGLQVWSLPLASPIDADRGDTVFHLALVKAAMEGDFVPVRWKAVTALGAPGHANWNDWPIVEEIPTLWMAMVGHVAGLVTGYNLCLAAASVLAALTFFGVARTLGCTTTWSFVGGLAFGLAPFTFAQTPHHPFIAQTWHIPFCVLIWHWVASKPGLAWRSPRFWFAIAVGFVTGLHSPYYTNIFCQLTLLAALATYARTGERGPVFSALAVIGAAAAAFALMNLDTWTYRLTHGLNPGALVREYKWLEIYGLKLVDLVVPAVTHRADPFAAFAAAHRAAAPLQDEGSYLGLVGIATMLMLVGTAVTGLVRGRARDVPADAWWVLWIVLAFSTGGLNTILGAFGFTLFRTGCRYSVVILAITLLYGVRRLTDWQKRLETRAGGDGLPPEGARIVTLTLAAALTALILFDQVPRAPTHDQATTLARQVEADRDFVHAMEAALPENAMVFQLPVMEFPESPLPGMASYDHFRPYLHSNRLRFSFGAHKGREQNRWQQELQHQLFAGAVPNQQAQRIDFRAASVGAVTAALQERGFAALYLNRNGFPDRGKGLEKSLRDAGLANAIESAAGDLVCVPFRSP